MTKIQHLIKGTVATAALMGIVWTRTASADCVNITNQTKWVQGPNVASGMVSDASYHLTLADDFNCRETGPISDIHLWGSWLKDDLGAGATFILGIWSDAPGEPGRPYRHPGTQLWSQPFSPGQYTMCPYSDVQDDFIEPNDESVSGNCSQLYFLSFHPTQPFTQRGTPDAPINYWLSVHVRGAGPPQFGWNPSSSNYRENAVYAFQDDPDTLPGSWIQGPNQPLGYAFILTTQTNDCPPPTIQCSDLNLPCGSPWPPTAPAVDDPCCPDHGPAILTGTVTNGQIIKVTWQYTNCQQQSLSCSQTVTIPDCHPTLTMTPLTGFLNTFSNTWKLTWTNWNGGVLQHSLFPHGPFEDVPGASSPFIVQATNASEFFRLRKQAP